MGMTAVGAAALATAGAFNSVTASLTNLPSGFKVAAAEYGAQGPGGGGGVSTSRDGGPMSTTRDGSVVITGNVTIVAHDLEDFRKKITREQYVRTGTTVDAAAARRWVGQS